MSVGFWSGVHDHVFKTVYFTNFTDSLLTLSPRCKCEGLPSWLPPNASCPSVSVWKEGIDHWWFYTYAIKSWYQLIFYHIFIVCVYLLVSIIHLWKCLPCACLPSFHDLPMENDAKPMVGVFFAPCFFNQSRAKPAPQVSGLLVEDSTGHRRDDLPGKWGLVMGNIPWLVAASFRLVNYSLARKFWGTATSEIWVYWRRWPVQLSCLVSKLSVGWWFVRGLY